MCTMGCLIFGDSAGVQASCIKSCARTHAYVGEFVISGPMCINAIDSSPQDTFPILEEAEKSGRVFLDFL